MSSALLGCGFSCDRFSMQFQSQRTNNSENGIETGISLSGECLIETFTGQTGVTGYL